MSDDVNVKTRNYATIVYPEDYESYEHLYKAVEQMKVPTFMIIHDKDLKDNQPVKIHAHVFIQYQNTKPIKHARKLFETIKGVGCEVVNSSVGYVNYMLHRGASAEDKYQYSSQELLCFNGADFSKLLNTENDKFAVLKEIIQYCNTNNIWSFSSLVDYSLENNEEWFRVSTSHAYFLKEYIKSNCWKAKTLGSCQP